MASYAKVICDSLSPAGARLTTIEMRYPLIVHNELLTHRAIGKSDDLEFDEWLEFSRNASSNRARTSKDIIAEVLADPYIPKFRYATTGMVPGDYFTEKDQLREEKIWLGMLDLQITGVQALDEIKAAKQWRNRLLGPWQYITVVATANDQMWEHFFTLRDHYAAQDELHEVASLAHEGFNNSSPLVKEWHLPYAMEEYSKGWPIPELIKMSVARCARVSSVKQGDIGRDDFKLYDDLVSSSPPHASPLEHVAQALPDKWARSGNFYGWAQWRKIVSLCC
jgi:hypothetical protein